MDWSLRPCTSTYTPLWDSDRLSTLPDELLIRILSLLPTKDAAAAATLSTRLWRILSFITNLDFDASTISHCVERPYAVDKYPTFIAFVTTVLLRHRSLCLNRFRLKVGPLDFISWNYRHTHCSQLGSKQDCLPDLKSSLLSAWISFPLRLCGLRELDLCISVRQPDDVQLPAAIFTCQTLEVLKLEVNIGIHEVLAMPSYSLPRLKVLFFTVSFISDESFLPRLLASCPLLEVLEFRSFTKHVNRLIIQSTSLRRLFIDIRKVVQYEDDINDFVYIDTPNLEDFEYDDNLSLHYSISITSRLAKASLTIWELLWEEPYEVSFQQLLNLIKPLSYVQHLTLNGRMFHVFYDVDLNVHKDQLPMFPNLKQLSLGGDFRKVYWDKLLLPLLNCTPLLETLIFTEGEVFEENDWFPERELEQLFFATSHPIPSCCRYHLKTIVMHQCVGNQRENEFIRFILGHALVLENLIIHCLYEDNIPVPNKTLVESTLISLPKASVRCSIQVL